MADLKDLALKIQAAIQDFFPEDVGFVLIMEDLNGDDIGISSNLNDEDVLFVLQEAVETVVSTEATLLQDDRVIN
jgi:hypothetical protein